MQKTDQEIPCPPAPLWRRLMAMLYDSLLLVAILMLATLPIVALFDSISSAWARHAFQLYLFAIAYVFFSWFWVHGGQTLGMRSWRLQLVGVDDAAVGWKMALVRFMAALLSGIAVGLGYLWALLDTRGRTWHDHMSGSFIILLPKTKKKKTG
ncbi:MAG: RDD family protein [Acidiferrobacterales bacterium]